MSDIGEIKDVEQNVGKVSFIAIFYDNILQALDHLKEGSCLEPKREQQLHNLILVILLKVFYL
jgi:hypothetical protein